MKPVIIEVPYFKYYRDYMLFYYKNIIKFKEVGAVLKVFDGIPGSRLNGGRSGIKDGIPSKENMNFVLTSKTCTSDDIEIDPAFEILKEYDNNTCAVITGDYRILNKCKRLFKNFSYIYSITAVDIENRTPDELLELYLGIEKDFDYIVPRVELFDILGERTKELDISRYILLESYECYGCPLYQQHFTEISNIDIGKRDPKFGECWIRDPDLLKELGIDLPDYQYKTSQKNIDSFLEMPAAGYKIGRNNQSLEIILEDIMYILDYKRKLKGN